MERDGSPGDDGSRYIDDRSGNLCMAVERAAIMFDFEVERTALAGMADNASGAIFNVDGEVVSAVELAVWACTSDAVKAASTLNPAGRLDAEGRIPGVAWPVAVLEGEV